MLNIENEVCHDTFKVASYFNDFFTSIASVLVEKLPCGSQKYDLKSDCLSQFYKNKNPDNKELNLKHISESFVLKELNGLNISKSTAGLDGIWARFLKAGAHVLNTYSELDSSGSVKKLT